MDMMDWMVRFLRLGIFGFWNDISESFTQIYMYTSGATNFLHNISLSFSLGFNILITRLGYSLHISSLSRTLCESFVLEGYLHVYHKQTEQGKNKP